MGDGDAPVRAYIDAMPGWKREVGLRLDAIITRAAPGIRENDTLDEAQLAAWVAQARRLPGWRSAKPK
ncbi:MAG: hypothetical protein RL354_1117 [Planctomycetota bacterium]